ncbi:MAG: MarR family winged helix-turn-helix transcriptional regulator [Pseudonocardia sp.]|nr:MarR family winged helix-turn-helix transcriptional regulator [Pseudonocardia sp.]
MFAEPPDLDGRLVEAVERLGDTARALLRRAAAAPGLSPPQAQLLLRITSATAPRTGTGALAGWLEVSAPTVSDALGSLAAKGLAERARPSDPRAWTATPRGHDVARRLRRWRDPLLAALLDQPAARKADALTALLQMIATLNADGHISTARTCLTCRFLRDDPPGDAWWCTLLDTALAPADLRVDCPEHAARPTA